jgi:hypothetical protein
MKNTIHVTIDIRGKQIGEVNIPINPHNFERMHSSAAILRGMADRMDQIASECAEAAATAKRREKRQKAKPLKN